jgi:hypothetical protein
MCCVELDQKVLHQFDKLSKLFIGIAGSSPCSQNPATTSYSNPDEYSFSNQFFQIHLNIILPFRIKMYLKSHFLNQNFVYSLYPSQSSPNNTRFKILRINLSTAQFCPCRDTLSLYDPHVSTSPLSPFSVKEVKLNGKLSVYLTNHTGLQSQCCCYW